MFFFVRYMYLIYFIKKNLFTIRVSNAHRSSRQRMSNQLSHLSRNQSKQPFPPKNQRYTRTRTTPPLISSGHHRFAHLSSFLYHLVGYILYVFGSDHRMNWPALKNERDKCVYVLLLLFYVVFLCVGLLFAQAWCTAQEKMIPLNES